MKLTQIPYTKLTGVEEEGKSLTLAPHQDIHNHFGGIHAGALFTLAETQSGHYLQCCFPNHQDHVVAMVRDASIKYKLPATQKVYATATIDKEALDKFQSRFERKGRGGITVEVEIKEEDKLIATASFLWYVQRV
ncbi:MAG: PaaI family thioesterase [Campylobacterota bacterium]|nr:PaaI family thioesterase [Campylobacterota bacterium]